MSEPENSSAITFEDFVKVELRFGKILSASRVPKSNKLIQMQVSFGALGDRQIVAGVGKTFEPEALVGKTYLFVTNLAPATLMGVVSHGMMLASGQPDALSLLTPSGEVEPGSTVK